MQRRYDYIDQAAGIALFIRQNGEPDIDLCQVSKKGMSLSFETKHVAVAGITELRNHVKPDVSLALNISGKGVGYKKISPGMEINAGSFAQVLPNADINDFYVQRCDCGNQAFVAFTRKKIADNWIDMLREQGLKVLMVTLGVFPVRQVIGQLNLYDDEAVFNGWKISRDGEGNWTEVDDGEELLTTYPVKVDLEVIDQRLIIPYAIAFQLILFDRLVLIRAEVPGVDSGFDALVSVKKLRFRSIVILVIFFVLLFVNFLVFSWLYSANNDLETRVSSSVRSAGDLEMIKTGIKTKEQILGKIDWKHRPFKSIMLDDIASLLPGEITWKKVSINPVNMAGRADRALQFTDDCIKITGTTEHILLVNEWIGRIKTKAWVKSAKLESYSYDHESGKGRFIITIGY